MTTEVDKLICILKSIDDFKKEYEYNPFDNYAWREVLTFDYLKTYYPTINKLAGRYGADGNCSELKLTYIEQKSTKIRKRKRNNDYNIRGSKYQVDVSKSLDKTFLADAFIFSLFDSEDSTYPIHVVFVHKPENVQKVKDLILSKHESFKNLDEDKRTHAHIDLEYDEIELLGEKFGDYMPDANIMEFIL